MQTFGGSYLRLFVEVESQNEARRIADKVVQRLAQIARIENSEVEQYWKIKSYYEIFVRFQPHRKPQPLEVAQKVCSELKDAQWQTDQEVIFDLRVSNIVCEDHPELRWLHIELCD